MGIGKLVTSISMTIFYVLLWHFGLLIFSVNGLHLATALVYGAAITRIVLCFFGQNRWTSSTQPLGWSILRNMPFVALGAIVVALYARYALLYLPLKWMWFAIVLSFVFYLPVAFWVSKNRKLGMLMFPKTCMYLWMLWMIYSLFSN